MKNHTKTLLGAWAIGLAFILNPGSARAAGTDGIFGSDNTGEGASVLASLTSGQANTANGAFALTANTEGSGNTGTGAYSLYSNTTGIDNTAHGYTALENSTTGNYNTANGFAALQLSTTGSSNTANGYGALYQNTTGASNTADGVNALNSNTTGSNNTALGNGAGSNLTTGNNNINIGNAGVAAEANTTRIGTVGTQTAAYVAGVSGVTVPSSAPVVVDANGHLGTTTAASLQVSGAVSGSLLFLAKGVTPPASYTFLGQVNILTGQKKNNIVVIAYQKN